MNMEANNELAGDLFGDMVLEQAIKDKTEQYMAEHQAAQEEMVDGCYLNENIEG